MAAQRMIDRRGALGALGAASLAPWLLAGGGRAARAAAPMMGVARPTFYRTQLGGFEVTTLLDGSVALDGPYPIFGQDQSAEAVQELVSASFLPPTTMEIIFTPVLVNTGNELVLFDSGNAPGRPGAGNLVEALQAAGLEPGQIDVVAITHMHPDHIGGLMSDGKPTCPNARYVTGETEYDFWSNEERLSGPTEAAAKLVQANVVPLAEKMTFVKDEGEAVSGIHGIAGARPYARAHGLPHRERGPAPAALGRYREPLRDLGAAAGLARPLRHGQGDGGRNAQAHVRHGGDRPHSGDRLPHAVPGGRLHRQAGQRLALGAGGLPGEPVRRGQRLPEGAGRTTSRQSARSRRCCCGAARGHGRRDVRPDPQQHPCSTILFAGGGLERLRPGRPGSRAERQQPRPVRQGQQPRPGSGAQRTIELVECRRCGAYVDPREGCRCERARQLTQVADS